MGPTTYFLLYDFHFQAVISNQPEVITFLLSCDVSRKLTDKFGNTAADNALSLGYNAIAAILSN